MARSRGLGDLFARMFITSIFRTIIGAILAPFRAALRRGGR